MANVQRREGETAHSPPPLDETVLAITFVAEAGKQMLESSTSVSEVEDRLRRFLPAVGLDGCALEATMSSLTLSYWKPGRRTPITTMRDINVADPRLERLSETESLLDQVERGELDLRDAFERLHTLAHAPGLPLRYVRTGILVSVLGWVLFLNGLDVVTVLVALLATLLTFPVNRVVGELRLPSVSETFLAAVVIAAIPNLIAAAGVSVQVGPAVVGALFVYLPGRALVSSVIDGLANEPLSAMSRGLQALVAAGSLAIGMLIGTRIGAGLGLHYKPDLTATPVALSVLGAAVGVLGLAVAWAMPRGRLWPTIAIGAGGWLVFAVTATPGDATDWVAYGLAAGLVGVSGVLVASRQGATASIYTGVAILPLVPGYTLYRGVLSLSQGDDKAALAAFGDAAIIALAIAVGLAFGLAVGRDLQAARERLGRRRRD